MGTPANRNLQCPLCEGRLAGDQPSLTCTSCGCKLKIVDGFAYPISKPGSLYRVKMGLWWLFALSLVVALLQHQKESPVLVVTGLCGGLLFLVVALDGIFEGSIQSKGAVVIYRRNPIFFVITVALVLAMSVMMFYIALTVLAHVA